MAVVQRSTGITVTTLGSVDIREAPARGAKRGGKRGAPPAAPALKFDVGAIVTEMQRQDAELIDVVPLEIKPTATGAARIKRGPTPAPGSSATLDVPLADDQHAVVLVEDEGEFRWVLGTQSTTVPPKRGIKQSAPRRVRFQIDLSAPMAPSQVQHRVKRNWIVDEVVGYASVYVFRFALRLTGKPLVAFLERHVQGGLVSIGSPDPTRWKLLSDRQSLPKAPPRDRPARVLLLVHGTFSSTLGSYGALGSFAEGQEFLTRALSAYDFVLGFDHPTLSVDPEVNATALLERLRSLRWPQGVELEMVAFSRGGLVVRSLVERLLPGARWNVTIGRVVFVGCTNSGTQLAEPANWQRFADHYTNLALGATRALAYVPGTQPWTSIASQVIRGIGALVKGLTAGAVTDNVIPGLAAMEPDGPFVTSINRKQPGQPEAADAKYYAITTNFEPRRALDGASVPEIASKFLLRLANWGADELYREPNDLVVHVRSMTAFDPGAGDFIKGRLEFGTNGTVYHTNYFAQPQTAQKLSEWFGLAAAGVKRGAKRGVGKRALPPPRPSGVVKISERPALADYRRALTRVRKLLAGVTLPAAPTLPVPKPKPKRAPAKKLAAKRRRLPIGGGGGRMRRPARAPAKKARSKRPPLRKIKIASRKPGTAAAEFIPELALNLFTKLAPDSTTDDFDTAPGGGVADGPGDGNLLGGEDAAGGPTPPRTPRAEWPPAQHKRGLRRGAPPANAPLRVSVTEEHLKPATPAESAKAKMKCYFKAEMDARIRANVAVPVEVTISRDLLDRNAEKSTASAAASVDPKRKLIVEIGELRQLRIKGKRKFEVDVPKEGKQVTCKLEVVGPKAAQASVTVHIRQDSIPVASLELATEIVTALGKATSRARSQKEQPANLPDREEPLDELRIYEQSMGDKISYAFMLDLWSERVRGYYQSQPLPGARDKYVQQIMNEIGDAWIASTKGGKQLFEDNIRAIGGQMFDQLIPEKLQKALWESRNKIKSVQVFSLEPFIPWELVFLKPPGQRRADPGSRFLGELGLLRWVYSSYPPSRLRIRTKRALYVIGKEIPQRPLPNAQAEAAMLKKLFDARALDPDVSKLNQLLQKPDAFDLLHICCHGTAAGEDFSQAQLFIEGEGETLKATTVQQGADLAKEGAEYRPIVVLNACESGRANREFVGLGGFAHAFVGAGAGLFVGSQWSIGDSPALKFIQAMYEALKSSKRQLTLSEAVTQARLKARGDQDATWLAYVVYGHPRATVSFG